MAGVMIFNNLLGFTGISVFARYLVTPLLILWALYMVIKGFVADGGSLGGTPAAAGSPFWVAVVAVIGFSMWGNEPDFWRYGKPRFAWPLPTYLFAAVWFTLFTMGGWMMAALAKTDDSATIFNFTVHYSLFGAFWLAWIIATVSQFAINDGNYYESVNAGQNLVGGWSRWRRPYTVLLVAVGGVIAADLVNFHFLNGWFKVATLPRDLGAVGDGDHGRRPLPAAAALQALAAAHEGADVGGGRAVQLARGDRPARRGLLRRDRLGELAERLARLDAAEQLGPGAARVVADRGRALHRARRDREGVRLGSRAARDREARSPDDGDRERRES